MTKLDVTQAENQATYAEIQAYVLEHTGLKASCLQIAQVKAKHGIIERDCYLDSTLASRGGQYMLQNAVEHTLHMQANNASFDVKVATGYPIYKLLLIAYNVLTFIYMAWATLEIVHKLWPGKKLLSRKGFRILRIVLGTLGVLILGVLLWMFFTTWLPTLQFALQTAV